MSRAVSILSNATSRFSFVDLMPCFCRFMCPLSVAGEDSGKYCWTTLVVIPGQVGNWLLAMALSIVLFGGLKRH